MSRVFPADRRVSVGTEPFGMVQVDIRYRGGDESDQIRVVEVVRRTATAPDGRPHGDLAEFVSTYAAGEIVDEIWPTVTERWRVTDVGHLDGVAAEVDSVKTFVHAMVIGQPIDQATSTFGILNGLGQVAADMLPLPIDRDLDRAIKAIRIVGVIVGIASGNHLLAISCVKSLAKDKVTDLVAVGVRDAITDTVRGDHRGVSPGLPGTDDPNRGDSVDQALRLLHAAGVGIGEVTPSGEERRTAIEAAQESQRDASRPRVTDPGYNPLSANVPAPQFKDDDEMQAAIKRSREHREHDQPHREDRTDRRQAPPSWRDPFDR